MSKAKLYMYFWSDTSDLEKKGRIGLYVNTLNGRGGEGREN